ncbi:MAG: cytochrome c3 family protein [Thermodesulfovibrionales bacterium]|nr:cytochrome c3 family protein [Thermodesulfovibrionales bacterium]
MINVQREFTKAYHHPIETSGLHEYREDLPETIPSAPRHVACVDCHHHHYVSQGNKHVGIKGTNVEGSKIPNIMNEYELCFNCHSYSANLPSDQMNKASLFNPSNPSYHPIVAQGKNNNVPSLQMPFTETSIIKCTDCHNNDDISGPKGPHGSSHMHLLKKNFNSDDSAEGLYQYELCYSCHMRTSILNNESFPYHKLHLTVVGSSCRTCHNPHGSTLYAHMIDLDDMSISPSDSGALEFRDLGPRAGECFLSCHGKNHGPARYP